MMTYTECAGRRELSRIINTKASEIAGRWLERVSADLVQTPTAQLTTLRDGIRDYLGALAELLAAPGNGLENRSAASWARVARDHGVLHVRVGFDIDQLIHEFVTLRHVIQTVLRESRVALDGADSTLADLVDAAIAESVRAYVRARDHEVRRVQAETIGFLTHELRNPLAAAVQAEGVVRAEVGSAPSRALDALERSHVRLTELIDRVLATERLEAGKVKPRFVETTERDVIEPATAVARQAAVDKGLAFAVRFEANRRVRLDPDLTRSALQNLVDNAVKYTDAGHVEVAVDATDAIWSVHVRDTCPGLSPEELRTIFEPFRRGSTAKQGTGLGLAIARRAVEAQGGSLHAESVGSRGCHFWIAMPRH